MTDNNAFQPQDEGSSEGIVTRRLDPSEAPTTPQSAQGGWADVGQDWKAVGEEFKKLGARLSTAIRSGWQSEQEGQLTGLQDQLRAMADQVEAAVRSAKQEALSPEVKAQTARVVERAKEAQTTLVEEVRDTVAAGLRALNAQLRELAERLESGRK